MRVRGVPVAPAANGPVAAEPAVAQIVLSLRVQNLPARRGEVGSAVIEPRRASHDGPGGRGLGRVGRLFVVERGVGEWGEPVP